MSRPKRRKPRLPRAPLPRQTGGAHGSINQKQVRVLRRRIRDALDRRGEE